MMNKDEIDRLNQKILEENIANAFPRDFPEDFHLENGNYFNTCCLCKYEFVGYKRRVVCKLCDKGRI